jgi:hypothetical protein
LKWAVGDAGCGDDRPDTTAFNRFTKERLRCGNIPLRAQSELDRPAGPVNGTFDQVEAAIGTLLHHITPHECINYFRQAGYAST